MKQYYESKIETIQNQIALAKAGFRAEMVGISNTLQSPAKIESESALKKITAYITAITALEKELLGYKKDYIAYTQKQLDKAEVKQ